MKKVLFVDTVHPYLWEELQKEGYSCIEGYDLSEKAIIEQHNDIYGLVIRSRISINANFLSHFNKLTFIARAGSGMENIDVNYAHSKNIHAINAAEGNKQAVAEHALGMILSLFNNLNKADSEVRKGIWQREENRGIELNGKTIGIIGYGNNGSAFAEVLKGFGVNILAYDKYLENYPYQSSMKKIYQEADILSLHVPLTKETSNLINRNFIKNFQKEFYLINTARGRCVDTKELVSALESGKIKGACLDVFAEEKKSFENLSSDRLTNEMQYLINSNKTILSCHIAGWTVESNIKISTILLQKITSDFEQ